MRHIATLDMYMRGKWVLISILALLVGIGGAALSMRLRDRAKAGKRMDAAALLPMPGDITLSGTLRPQNVTSVGPEEDADLDSFQVEVGQDVFEGQVLARLGSSGLETERENAQTAVNEAESKVTKAEQQAASARMEASRTEADQQRMRSETDRLRREFEHQDDLYSKKAAPKLRWQKAQKDYETAQRDFDVLDKSARLSAEAAQTALNALTAAQKSLADRNQELAAAQEHMQAAEVRAPADGVVVARNGEPGKPAPPDLIVLGTDMFSLEVTVEPKPELLKKLQPGQQVLVLIPDMQSSGMEGRIKEIKEQPGHRGIQLRAALACGPA